MPNRDYAARSNKSSGKSSVNKLLILVIVLLLLGMSALALMLLKSKEPVVTQSSQPAVAQHPKSELPTPPAEIYSYIRDLETREVPIDKNAKIAQLTREQEQQLQRQKEEEKRKLELQQQQAAQVQIQADSEQAVQPEKQVIAMTAEEFEEKKEAEKRAAEEKRKQAELKKQQDAKKAQEQAKAKEQPKKEPAKVVAKASTEAPKVVGKFGLQCGAFKNKAQAENMQARLAMAGYNARINSSGDWNRVVVGPVGDRAAASKAQANARSVAECLIVGM